MSQTTTLLAALRNLHIAIVEDAETRIERWSPHIEREPYKASATNLAHYLALRRHDMRDLQRSLMRYGLSSLGRSESRVLATMEAGEDVLDSFVAPQGAPS